MNKPINEQEFLEKFSSSENRKDRVVKISKLLRKALKENDVKSDEVLTKEGLRLMKAI